MFSWVTIILRCYCRAFIVKSFGSDDSLAVIAAVLYTVYCSFSITATFYGSGQLTSTIPSHDFPVGLKFWWLCEPVYVISAMAIKMSIGVFLYRVCVDRSHQAIIWITEAIMVITSLGYFFSFVFQCNPSRYFWTRYSSNGDTGYCMTTTVIVDISYGYSSISCLVDWTLGILPVFMLWNLQMDRRTKATVSVILALGAVASTATIIRIPYLHYLSDEVNFLYVTTDVAIWSTIEVGIAISASSFATLKPLFRQFFQATNLSSGSGRRSSQRPTGASRPGYVRSTRNGHSISLGLRNDNAKNGTVTTTITGNTEEQDERHLRPQHSGRSSGNWRQESRCMDDSSDDGDWSPRSQGITKTMEIRSNQEIV